MGGDEVGAGHDHLEDGAPVLAQQVDLVDDDQGDGLDVVARLPWRKRFNVNREE